MVSKRNLLDQSDSIKVFFLLRTVSSISIYVQVEFFSWDTYLLYVVQYYFTSYECMSALPKQFILNVDLDPE